VIRQRLGKIFDPTRHSLPNGCKEFAQSPQTLQFDTFTRVYFSTRALDQDGATFRSHIAFVDMTPDFTSVLRVSEHCVLPLGDLGTFDEHGIFPMNIVREGGQIWGYTCGWNRRRSVSVDTAVGFVVSDDQGETFRRLGPGPILGASLHEPFLVGDAFVLKAEDRFHMWYMFGQRWMIETDLSAPDRVYKIGHAISTDGLNWVKQDGVPILPDRLGPDECQALPSVIRFSGLYHMVFCYREMHGFRTDPAKGYRIGYAYSSDLVAWTRDDAALGLTGQVGDWDSDMQCYPHLTVSGGRTYVLYNGNAFGRRGFGAVELALE
jgi:hypothetical protein